ncbi:MAG: hypothetical protein JXJ18_08985 [Rhodobacteraceae bacterium]|nr:hypothetical protein [Paracoccaceae bacterium]
MPQGVKIATCCYCGTRAALELRGIGRHELSCASCGAPLHEMKRLRLDHGGKVTRPKTARTPAATQPHAPRPKPRKKRRKGFWREALEEAFDVVEDLFD